MSTFFLSSAECFIVWRRWRRGRGLRHLWRRHSTVPSQSQRPPTEADGAARESEAALPAHATAAWGIALVVPLLLPFPLPAPFLPLPASVGGGAKVRTAAGEWVSGDDDGDDNDNDDWCDDWCGDCWNCNTPFLCQRRSVLSVYCMLA